MPCIYLNQAKKQVLIVRDYCHFYFIYNIQITFDDNSWSKGNSFLYKLESLTKFLSLTNMLKDNIKVTNQMLKEQRLMRRMRFEMNKEISLLLQELQIILKTEKDAQKKDEKQVQVY